MRKDTIGRIGRTAILLLALGACRRHPSVASQGPATTPSAPLPSKASPPSSDSPVDAAISEGHASADLLRVLAMGDSLTDGERLPGGWRPAMKRACANLRIDFVGSRTSGPPGFDDPENEGHTGWTIDRVGVRAAEWTRAASPDVILLMLGTNDVAIGTRLDSAPTRLADVARAVANAAPRALVLVSTLPTMTRSTEWRGRVEQFNRRTSEEIGSLARDGVAVRFVDVGGAIHGSDLRDGVHPSAQGNEQLGRAWCRALEDGLAADGGVQEPADP